VEVSEGQVGVVYVGSICVLGLLCHSDSAVAVAATWRNWKWKYKEEVVEELD
jgi:ribosomal protein L7Ae-like RNA K-turn-binding protein